MTAYKCLGCGHICEAEEFPGKCGYCGDVEYPVFEQTDERAPQPAAKGKRRGR